MERRIKIFKTFAEHEKHQLQRQIATTPLQRFKNLFYMQQLSLKFRPKNNTARTLVFHHGYTSP